MSLPAYAVDRDAVLNNAPDDIQWRTGKPNYAKANALYDRLKSIEHVPGSLEMIVQNLVKNWEKEASHKINPRQWDTVDYDNYRFSCNGLQTYTADEMLKEGTYNALIGDTLYYKSSAIDFEESHAAFKRTLGEGFAWEVIEVYSGPPTVVFKWRHFGPMTDSFSCPGYAGVTYKADPTNKMINLYGVTKATVTADLKIQNLETFFDPNQMFIQLTESCPFAPFAQLASMENKPST